MGFWRNARAAQRIKQSQDDRLLFERTGDAEALRRALASAREVVDLAPAESAPLAASMLSRALRMTFERTGDESRLREAVTFADRALAGIAEGSPNWSSFQNEVATVRLVAFQRFDSPDDLTCAVAAAEVAAEVAAVAARPTAAQRMCAEFWHPTRATVPRRDRLARPAGPDRRPRPEQGWYLLCNGIVLFDDGGLMLPVHSVVAPAA